MTPPEHIYDVAIIGAGPTGLTAANLLGQAGLSTLLIERNARTVSEPRAVVIDDEAMRTFQACKLDQAIAPNLRAGRATRYFSRVGAIACFAEVNPKGDEYGFPKRMRFHQPDLERVLRDGLSRFANVDCLFDTRLDAFQQTAQSVQLQLSPATAGPRRAAARYLLACDGGSSSVRRALGVTMSGDSFAEPWLVLDLVDDPFDPDDTLIICDPRRPTVSVPGPNKRRRFEFLIKPGEREEEVLAPGAAEALLGPYGYNAATPARIERRTVYAFHARVAQQWRTGRVFLAGDSAHMMPPFMGQGMNSCIRDAHNVCWKLAGVLQGALSDSALDSYEAERRPHVTEMVNISASVARLAMTTDRARALLRDFAFRSARVIPVLRNYLNQQMFKPRPEYRGGLFLGNSAPNGRLAPQPVLTRHGETVRMDDLLGPSFALLGLDAAPEAIAPHPLWQSLAPARLHIGDAPGAWRIAHDNPMAALLARHRGSILFVRPDRYVCGVFTPSEASGFADAFVARFGSARSAVAA